MTAAIMLAVLVLGLFSMVMAIRADAREQREHDEWMRGFLDRLYGRGPR